MNGREPNIEGIAKREERLARWYDKQSERLGLTRDELTAAVLRGWTGDEIAKLPASEVEKLAGNPCSHERESVPCSHERESVPCSHERESVP